MAFTDAQKRDIRKYMGVPFGFYDLQHRLESMIYLVGENVTDRDQVILWLNELAALDAAIGTASAGGAAASYGSIKKADEVEFYSPKESLGYTAVSSVDRGRSLIARLARALGVSDCLPIGDYFGRSRSSGSMIQLG